MFPASEYCSINRFSVAILFLQALIGKRNQVFPASEYCSINRFSVAILFLFVVQMRNINLNFAPPLKF